MIKKSMALLMFISGIYLIYKDWKMKPIIKYRYIPRPLEDTHDIYDIHKPMFDKDGIWLERYKSNKIIN